MLNVAAISRPGGEAAIVLAVTDPGSLSDEELIEFTRAAERQVAHANAVALAAVRVLAERAATAGTELARGLQRRRSTTNMSAEQEQVQRVESEARRSELAERAAAVGWRRRCGSPSTRRPAGSVSPGCSATVCLPQGRHYAMGS